MLGQKFSSKVFLSLYLAIMIYVSLGLAAWILGTTFTPSYFCKSRWPDFETKYTYASKCLVKPTGKSYFIPENAFREVTR